MNTVRARVWQFQVQEPVVTVTEVGQGELPVGLARLIHINALHRLDIGGLSWIHDHPDGSPGASVRIEPRAYPAPADAAERAAATSAAPG